MQLTLHDAALVVAIILTCAGLWPRYFVASYSPDGARLWLPFAVECIRAISVSFFRMQVPSQAAILPRSR